MKTPKLFITLCAIFLLNFSSYSALSLSSVSALPKTETVTSSTLSVKDQYYLNQMKRFIAMTATDYENLRGKKLNFLEKLSFKLSQQRMKSMLKHYSYGDGPSTLQKIGWLIKGLLFGPLALILGYIFLKDDDRELIKWIWFGFAGFAVIVALSLLAV